MKFTETRAYRYILKTLEKRHHVVILGRPGDGKTTLGFQALHSLKEKHNSTTLIPVVQELQFLPHLSNDQTYAIFLDDMFGIYTVSGKSLSKPLVYQILSFIQKGSFIVMSMRKEIYLQCKLLLPKELFSKDVIVDISSDDFELLEDEKRSMLNAMPDIDEDTAKTILNHKRFGFQQIGFPQCVALMKESKSCEIQNILDTPLEYITEQLLLLHEHSRGKFLAVLLAFVNDGKICENDLNKLRQALPTDLDDSSLKPQEIKQAVRTLDMTYLKHIGNDKYIINHESIMDGVARTLWEELRYYESFIMSCPERFLTRLSSTQSEGSKGCDLGAEYSNIFFISNDYYGSLFQRLVGLLESGSETSCMTVANIELWDDPTATSKFVHYMNQRTQGQNDINGTLLTYAAIQGRLHMVEALLEGARQHTETVRSAFMKSAKHCRLNVVNYLLSQRPDLVDLDVVFHAINGKSIGIYQAVSSHAKCVDYKSKRESMICTFFAETDNVQVNILEEIILSGNIGLLQYIIQSEQIDLHEMASCNPRMLEFAAYSGSVELMQFIFNRGCKMCPHLLWWGICSGATDMLKYLLDKGCNFNLNKYVSCDIHINQMKNLHGLNEMHGACFGRNREIVMHLFHTNPEFIHMKDSDGSTPALLSPWSGSLDIVKYLEVKGDITSVDKYGQNILHHAAWQGQLDIVKYLTEKYQSFLNMKDIEGRSPLHFAGISGSVEVVNYLIDKNCNVYTEDRTGETLLHNACQGGKLTLVRHLAENYPLLLMMRNNLGQTPLHTAGWSGSVEVVNYLIIQQCDVLDKSSNGRTILHHACYGGRLTLVKHLVEKYPVLLTMRDDKGLTPLHSAGWSDSVELVDYLINQQHCDAFDQESYGRTILHNACNKGKLTLVKHLVENYPTLLPTRDNKGLTPLHTAGGSGSMELVDYLVHQHQCDVFDKDSYGRNILHYACQEGKLTLVKHLVENYPALLTMRDDKGLTPLHRAGWSNSVGLVEYLIIQQCDVLDKDSYGRTILHHACQEGKLTLVKHLVESYPALLAMRDKEGLTPLQHAGWSDSVNLVEYLISQQCDVLDKDSYGRTILHNACQKGKLTLVKHLVEKYRSLLPMRDKEGLTPLHVAGWSGSVELVDYLISQHSNVNGTDNYGRTILHCAWRKGKLMLIKHLVDNYPALITTMDNWGMMPQHYAVYSDSIEMMEYLTKHGDAFDMNFFGRTILHIACQEGKPILVRYLAANCPALLTVADSEGLTPLHIVCGYGTSDLVDFLIDCGADPTVKDNSGRTPFDFAVYMENTEVIMLCHQL